MASWRVNDGFGENRVNDWQDKAALGAERKSRMMSFGINAGGILVHAKHGDFIVDPEDSSVSLSLLTEGAYSEGELELAASLIDTASEVLIVGPHIGALAVPLSKLCARMDVVEANPYTQRLLAMNLRLNDCDNVTLHRMAASNESGQITFLVNRENSGGSKRAPLHEHMPYIYDEPERVTVNAESLDEVVGSNRYDLIFMDIEGSEYFALQGMQKILGSARAIVIEFLPHHLVDVAGASIADFTAQIVPHFQWMYVPGEEVLYSESQFPGKLQSMFDSGQGHEGIYFLKAPSDAWLHRRGLTLPAKQEDLV